MARRTTTKKKKFKDTSANRKKRWNKKSPMARTGKQNGAWKGGKSAHYYRRKANAGKNEVVHHKNKGKHTAKNAKRSNLKKVTPAQHNKLHPEKGRKAAAARKRKGTKRKTRRKKK
jgi:hypothetical protein|tara:strand:- start:139 stop:486 length:348 start_codon:yes stop_codon:yes gene_type:complete